MMLDPLDLLALLDPTGLSLLPDFWPDLLPDASFSSGDPPELARVYEAASARIAEDPDDVVAYFRRGVVAQSKRWHVQAFHDFSEVLKRDRKHARAWLLMSEVLAGLGHHDAARQAREEALALDPGLAS